MANLQAAVENTVLQTAKIVEDELDAEIERLENMNSEELERLRWVNYSHGDPCLCLVLSPSERHVSSS